MGQSSSSTSTTPLRPVQLNEDASFLRLLDQRALPDEELWLELDALEPISESVDLAAHFRENFVSGIDPHHTRRERTHAGREIEERRGWCGADFEARLTVQLVRVFLFRHLSSSS